MAEEKKREYSEARKRANIKWDKQNLDRASFALPSGELATVKAHAEKTDGSLNKFVRRAILETMERDGE